ncbi:MAG: SDR family NAD(P)-dependent oxidoreductase, partial [Methylovulum sp.]
PAASSRYRKHGVYVVIGGAGGIGTAWSRYMIEHYQAQLIWIGRRSIDAEIRQKLDTLAQIGPAPRYIQADAGNLAALHAAYDDIKRSHQQIHGVIHSAIVLQDQSLANMDEERFRAGLSAKVDTSVCLAEVFQHEELDFAVFFSSAIAFEKVPGQSNYAAGSTFADALARQLAKTWSCTVKLVNWGYWGSVGIVSDAAYQQRMARAGLGSIEPDEGIAALDRLLNSAIDQMVVIKTIKPAETL